MAPSGRLRLFDYYALEAVSAMASVLFLYCYFFYTKLRFGFSDTENLMLGAAQGLTYVFFAKYGGRFAERAGYERVLLIGYSGMALLLFAGSFLTWHYAPFLFVAAFMACIAPTWPSLEAAIMHTPSPMAMPARLGIYNVVWSLAGAIGFFLSGFIFEWRPNAILWIPGLMCAAQVVWLTIRKPSVAPDTSTAMDIPHRGDHVPRPAKRKFLHTAWLANGVGYFMGGGFTAMIPHLGERLHMDAAQTIWLTCTQLFARSIAFIIFWRWEGWHYRMPWSQAAIWAAPAGLAVAFFSRSPAFVLAALLLNGIAFGLSYYTSIYYSLDYGESKGEHGGLHESILGIGMLTGPLAGVIGSLTSYGADGAKMAIVGGAVLASAAGMAFIWRRA